MQSPDKDIEQKADAENSAKTYYESDDSYRYYSIIYTEDYTGAGFFPAQIEVETPDAPGVKYPIGTGCQIFEAVQARDMRMVDHVLMCFEGCQKKLSLLELGSGRGGLTRFMAKELLDRDMLGCITAGNIAERENEYNLQQATKQGIPQDKFGVIFANFDHISTNQELIGKKYDVIYANDCFLHSSDKKKMISEISKMLNQDGILVFSDILEKPDSD